LNFQAIYFINQKQDLLHNNITLVLVVLEPSLQYCNEFKAMEPQEEKKW
jgi:hypothetical protein